MTLRRGDFGDGDLGPNYEPTAFGQRSVNGSLISQNRNKTVSLQATYADSKVRTLTFNLQPIDSQAGVTNPLQAEAFIEFAVDGNTVTRRVSLLNGTSISGVANAIRVVMTDTTQTGGVGSGKEYSVQCSIADGERSGNSNPPTLAPWPTASPGPISLAPGIGQDFLLPSDAGISSISITVFDTTGAVVADGTVMVSQYYNSTILKYYDPRVFDFAPLQPGTNRVRVDNKSATQTIVIQALYGIDG